MSATSKVDPSTLGWVKNEIDETLKQARLALESYTENPSDDTRLRFCVTHLHQVVGTLEMVELDGAAMLAREAESLARNILDERIKADGKTFDILTRAILTLPDYLARLQFGQTDNPIGLVPVINELRAIRGAEQIDEVDLFEPDLSVRPVREGDDGPKIDEDTYRELAKKLRHSFQAALLKWLRDTSDKESLNKIADILSQLGNSNIGVIEQLFWVADGFVEALISGDLKATNERKKLFSRLDQQIRKLVEGSDRTSLRSSSESLVKKILFEIGRSRSEGPKVTRLKQAFELDQLLSGVSDDADFAAMPTPEALQSVSVALAKEIETAQDLLSAYFDPEQEDVVSLEPLLELLHKMSSTIDMLGVPMLKELVDELVSVGKAVVDKQIQDQDTVAMAMARALLLIENSAREIHKSAASWKRQLREIVKSLQALRTGDTGESPELAGLEVRDTELSETEYNQLLGVVGDEIRINLNKIEEALESFAADARQVSYLDGVPAYLNQIQGALEILGQPRAAELTDLTLQCIEEIRNKEMATDAEVLDGLAVAIGTIGAYVEGLQYSRPNLDSLIDRAVTELRAATSDKHKIAGDPSVLVAEIEKQLNSWLRNTDDTSAISAISQHLDAIAALAQSQNQEKIARISGEMNKLLHIIHDDPGQLSDDIINTLKQSFDTMALLSKQYLTATTTIEPLVEELDIPDTGESEGYVVDDYEEDFDEVIEAAPEPLMMEPVTEFADDEDIDEEIVQIFIEDARDVMRTINKETNSWISDPDNFDSLLELRRGYHTLKGSGRMVGAGIISELAWAVENMLNKVRDRKITHSPAMFELLQEVQAVLPGLIEKFESGETPEADTESLRRRADEITASSPAAAPEVQPGVQAEAEETETAAESPKLDPTLLQIFTTEARGHIDTIRAEVKDCNDNRSSCLVTQNLLRATHTLRGSARSLGLMPMSDACGEMEKLLQEIQASNMPLTDNHIQMLTEIESSVSNLLDTLGQEQGMTEVQRERFARIQLMIHTEFQRLEDKKHAEPLLGTEEVSTPPPAPELPAAPSPEVSAAATTLGENVDPELLEIFLEEAVDILGTIDHSLGNWRQHPSENNDVHELKRALHTLKGGSRMAGVMTIGELSHNTESALKGVEDGSVKVNDQLFDLLDEVHDTLASMLEQIKSNQPLTDIQDLNARVVSLYSDDVPLVTTETEMNTVSPQPEVPAVSGNEAQSSAPVFDDPAPAQVATQASNVAQQPAPARDVPLFTKNIGAPDSAAADKDQSAVSKERGGVTRVRTKLLDDLVNYAGEVSISRSRMEQQIYGFRENLSELHQNVTRFREQLRELEIQSESQILYRSGEDMSDHSSDFDPLEFDRFSRLQQLSRSLTESLHDLSTIQTNLDNFVGDAETVLQQQARINTELQEGLMRTRMVSFSTQSARLRHIVRQTARELGKRAELKLIGSNVEVDRNVLEHMIGPFEHMIRNALDHGIEAEADRHRMGKPSSGTITIDTKQQGNEIVIRFSDDGKGLDIDAIRHKAVERGLINEDERLSDDAIIQFILVSGFSTSSRVTHLSGRGVGMDVVHNEVKRLGGSMSVDTQRGIGTTFVIRLPLTLSVTQALLVYAGEQIFAIPLSSVDNILEVDKDHVSSLSMGAKPMFNHNEQVYPYVNLASRLGMVSSPRTGRKAPVLLVRTGTREFAMQVDGLAGTREVVIKALSPMLAELAGFAGATILGDGTVILILDIGGLLLSEEGMQVAHTPAAAKPVKKREVVRERPLIMVVDDSLTVRKVTGKHLQKRGLEVVTAKDGLDAVEQLREQIPDLMLVDIEMPRMDGYELTKRVRSDPELQHVPIIMITSRAGEKHRKRAFDLGVNDYMSKPYQEDVLFSNIERLLKESE